MSTAVKQEVRIKDVRSLRIQSLLGLLMKRIISVRLHGHGAYPMDPKQRLIIEL